MNLHQYLLAIENNKAINLRRFIALLPAEHQQHWRNIFKKGDKTQGKDTYPLSVTDELCFKQLLQTTKPSNNRVDAAKKGDSHQHNTSMSFLLVYPNVLIKRVTSEKIKCPEVVVMDNTGLTIEFKPQKTLVIIENQENFFRFQEFLPQLLLTELTDVPIDITFGAGNTVTNSLNDTFFAQYQEILCCFDYDFGGLTMYASLIKVIKLMSNDKTKPQIHFILPSTDKLTDAMFINTHFKKIPEEAKHWQKAISLAEQLELPELAQVFRLSKKFMEQEVFLSPRS